MKFLVDAQLPLRLARVLQSAGCDTFILRIYLDEMQLRIQKLTCFPSKKAELLSPKIEIFSIHL
jgi:uncharacterized protein with PIN domain